MKKFKISTNILALISGVAVAACGSHRSASSTVQGAPHEFGVLCTSQDTDSSFRIYEGQGMLRQYGKPMKLFACEQVNTPFVDSPARMLYECREKDQENGAEVFVYSTGEDHQIKASVTDKKGGFEIAKLNCQK